MKTIAALMSAACPRQLVSGQSSQRLLSTSMTTRKLSIKHALWVTVAAVLGIAVLGYVRWSELAGTSLDGALVVKHPESGRSNEVPNAAPAASLAAVPVSGVAQAGKGTPPAKLQANMVNWDRFPGGLMPATARALREQDGRAAYELVSLIEACERLPESMERTRQHLTEMQAQRILKPSDQRWTTQYLNAMQQDLAQCQAVSGDRKALRRQLLEVAPRDRVEGAGMALFLEGLERPDVLAQVLREAEAGDGLAVKQVALGVLPAASPLQREAARDALVRGAQDPALNADPIDNLQRHLRALERHVAVEVARADPGNAAKAAAADTAYVGGVAPKLHPSSDPQVRALADQYLAALKRRQMAQQSAG